MIHYVYFNSRVQETLHQLKKQENHPRCCNHTKTVKAAS